MTHQPNEHTRLNRLCVIGSSHTDTHHTHADHDTASRLHDTEPLYLKCALRSDEMTFGMLVSFARRLEMHDAAAVDEV